MLSSIATRIEMVGLHIMDPLRDVIEFVKKVVTCFVG